MESDHGKRQATPPAEILICDWGSSRLRAYVIDKEGGVVGRDESDKGVKNIGAGERAYRKELEDLLGRLRVPHDIPIRISGMAGSKMGWIETGYLSTPAAPSDFVANFVPLPGFKDARLYGGLMHRAADGTIDVMRGEEVQLLGTLGLRPQARRICLPGTHSKWVDLADGRITSFKTYMTGDLFASLCGLSIFRDQIGSRVFDREGFLKGCRLAEEGNDLNDLFRLRTAFIFAEISAHGFFSCLSGFLIANEIRAARASGSVQLCGAAPLTEAYALALDRISVQSHTISTEQASIHGHLSLSRS